MNKKELIEKGLMPEKIDWHRIYKNKNAFEYEINGKYTLKLFDGTTLCKDVDWCFLYKNGFSYKIDGKRTLKLFDGAVICK